MSQSTGRLVRIAFLIGAVGALAGCDTIRAATGSDKQPPDEFAITTKAPLTIPPDYNLRPPAPGAAPANQVEPTQAAQQALFANADPATVAANMSGSMSTGEKLLLAYAGAQNAAPTIRQDVASDGHAMQSSSADFTQQVLDYQKPAAAPASDTKKPDETATADKPTTDKPAEDKPEEKKSGGWFDWF
jgi:hypothetical protein